MKKIGLFGGTFNPIHWGHIKVVKEVKQGFGLDKIWLIPAAVPPHKDRGNVAQANDRLEMIRLAVGSDSDFSVSDIELKRQGPSYTIDTLKHFKSSLSNNICLYFILGMDAFLEIDTWKSFRELFNEVPFIAISRPGTGCVKNGNQWKALETILFSKVSMAYRFDASKQAYVHPDKKPVYVFDVTPVDISATKIRKRIRAGLSIESMVPESVKEYIQSKGLYL
jgi:nicotinate-nucleotide adenylyltransferase